MQEGKLTDSRDVRELPGILENEDALVKFEKEGLKAARQVLQAADPSLSSNLYSAVDNASGELESISLLEITALQEGNDAKLEKLQRLAKAMKRVEEIAKIELAAS